MFESVWGTRKTGLPPEAFHERRTPEFGGIYRPSLTPEKN